MGQEPTTTAYALLGLLAFDSDAGGQALGQVDPGLTGYELKQRADNTLRFYWVSPAMSQVYAELARMERRGHVVVDVTDGRRTTRRYRISAEGKAALQDWLAGQHPGFPVLKHPVALRLLMGHLADPVGLRRMLDDYLDGLQRRRADLRGVRAGLGDDPRYRYPAMVADWGLDYYGDEERTVRRLRDRLPG